MNIITDLKKELEELDMFSFLLLPVWKELVLPDTLIQRQLYLVLSSSRTTRKQILVMYKLLSLTGF